MRQLRTLLAVVVGVVGAASGARAARVDCSAKGSETVWNGDSPVTTYYEICEVTRGPGEDVNDGPYTPRDPNHWSPDGRPKRACDPIMCDGNGYYLYGADKPPTCDCQTCEKQQQACRTQALSDHEICRDDFEWYAQQNCFNGLQANGTKAETTHTRFCPGGCDPVWDFWCAGGPCVDVWHVSGDCINGWLNGMPGSADSNNFNITIPFGTKTTSGAVGSGGTITYNPVEGFYVGCARAWASQDRTCSTGRNDCTKTCGGGC